MPFSLVWHSFDSVSVLSSSCSATLVFCSLAVATCATANDSSRFSHHLVRTLFSVVILVLLILLVHLISHSSSYHHAIIVIVIVVLAVAVVVVAACCCCCFSCCCSL